MMKKFLRDGKEQLRRSFAFFKDEQVEIRVRLLVLLQISVLAAISVGTVSMMLLRQPLKSILPNFLLQGLLLLGLYCSGKRNYQMASILLILGGANIMMPVMYFVAGGSNSGMPIWLVFGVVIACMMSVGKVRIIMVAVTLVEYLAMMLLGWYCPELITPMEGEFTGFFDMIQSFAVVSVGLCVINTMQTTTYERQREQLEFQRKETLRLMQTDELTKTFNRRAYYGDIQDFQQGKVDESLVLVAMDVNGLKQINDSQGHARGDLLLRSAADVIVRAFCKYGKVYRTGGDEFTALLHCTPEEARRLPERLQACVKLCDSALAAELSIAMGAVRWGEDPTWSFLQLERRADELMYENKRLHYEQKQQSADQCASAGRAH